MSLNEGGKQNVNLGATPVADDASEVGATITVTFSVPGGSGLLAVDGTVVNGLTPAQISGSGTNIVTLVGTSRRSTRRWRPPED